MTRYFTLTAISRTTNGMRKPAIKWHTKVILIQKSQQHANLWLCLWPSLAFIASQGPWSAYYISANSMLAVLHSAWELILLIIISLHNFCTARPVQRPEVFVSIWPDPVLKKKNTSKVRCLIWQINSLHLTCCPVVDGGNQVMGNHFLARQEATSGVTDPSSLLS